MNNIIVIGSINADLMISVPYLPRIGETILGDEFNYMYGGKGANQAVAAARAGGNVSLLAGVGDDTFGYKIINHLAKENISTEAIRVFDNMFTGLATVLNVNNDNSIIVSQGANALLAEKDIEDFFRKKIDANVLLTQLEIPINVVKKSLEMAKLNNIITILNPAPYNDGVKELIELVDFITPNETEFESLSNTKFKNEQELEDSMLKWSQTYETQLIVTRGSMGVSYVEDNKVITIPSIEVVVKDSTGAGDTLNGIFATEISRGKNISEAIKRASIGASLSVEHSGAQSGMPSSDDIDGEIN